MFSNADFLIWSLTALIVLVLLVLGFIFWIASRSEQGNHQTIRRHAKARDDTLRTSFRQAIKLIEANMAPRAKRLSVPWVLALNEGGAQPLPLAQLSPAPALNAAAQSANITSGQGISWHFFDNGVAINLQGAYLGTPESTEDDEQPWEQFLSLCRNYRPEQPFDSVVVNVPVDLLLSIEPSARLELSRLAKLSNRRLWKAQNRFAMRFPVYVVVSGCEQLPGFTFFAQALPDKLRHSMLGWSSPFELTLAYQEQWVKQAIDHTVQTLSDISTELYALNSDDNIAPYFLLPDQLENLRPQLQLYVNELMRPSSYHEPFLMRGIYFSGDANGLGAMDLQPKKILEVIESSQNNLALGAALNAPYTSLTADSYQPDADFPALMDRSHHVASAPALNTQRSDTNPFFLRDLFQQKIFAEHGLARPSGTQLTSLPLLGRGARWSALALIGGWGLSIVVGSVILFKQSDVLQVVLIKLQQDNQQRALALRNGEKISIDAENTRAVNLLGVMEQMDSRRLWSLFMPGSWPILDPLAPNIRNYLDNTFNEVAAATLQRSLHAKVSRLTGVPLDPSTGALIQGVTCSPLDAETEMDTQGNPMGFQELPEFAALLSYVSAVEQLDLAYGAMIRLQTPGTLNNPQDLRLLVKLVTGLDIANVSQRTADMFHTTAASAYAVRLEPAQEALRCSLRRHKLRLQETAFDNNVFLNKQLQLTASILNLTEALDVIKEAQTQSESLKSLLQELKDHEVLLAAGEGASKWMQAKNFQPGATWDALMNRIAASPLLGMSIAQQTQGTFEKAFKGLSVELFEALTDLQISEVLWDEKATRFVFGPELNRLRSGLSKLMLKPYMAMSNNLPAPALSSHPAANQDHHWKLTQLDDALATEVHLKKFLNELLPNFPVDSQPVIDQIVAPRLINHTMQQIYAALVVGPSVGDQSMDINLMELERVRLAKVQQLLVDLGATSKGDALRALINRHALRRLQALDTELNRSELYAPRGRSFRHWQGEKAPTLSAFGLQDAAVLQPYLTQQLSRAEQLSAEADALLKRLQRNTINTKQVQRWQNMALDLERFKLKNPNSSLLALENFLTAMAGDVDLQNCTERLVGQVPGGQPSDFFAERHMQLGSSLRERCSELNSDAKQSHLLAFTEKFSRTLAGRPPFARPGWSAQAPAAEIEEIAQLLSLYDKAKPGLMHLQPSLSKSPDIVSMARFATQFERSRAFLAPLVPIDDNMPIGYDISVEFRANKTGEMQGNQVIDWTLDIGTQRLTLHDPPKPMRWSPGQPITLTLRLAKDSQVTPVYDPQQPALSVNNKTVTLRYADAWSLFNLIGQHREAEIRNDGRSQLLRIEFPLKSELQPTASKPMGPSLSEPMTPPTVGDIRAKVFLRLTLSPPGKRTPLIWPGALPSRTPDPLKP